MGKAILQEISLAGTFFTTKTNLFRPEFRNYIGSSQSLKMLLK